MLSSCQPDCLAAPRTHTELHHPPPPPSLAPLSARLVLAAQPFPADYNEAMRQAQQATLAALADGAELVEVEFPTASLVSVAGDAEGGRVCGMRKAGGRRLLCVCVRGGGGVRGE